MPSSRADDIVDAWRSIASAVALPAHAPVPKPRPIGIEFGALAIASVLLIASLLRAPVGGTPGSGPGQSEAAMQPTLVADETLVAGATPSSTTAVVPSPSSSDAENPGGTCHGSQFDLGDATNYWFFTTYLSQKNGVSQAYLNAGPACVLVLPTTLFVARNGGAPVPVAAAIVDKTTFMLKAGEHGSIELTATWSTGNVEPGQTPEPCDGAVQGVRQAQVPVAEGRLVIDLGVTWREVCATPASLTITLLH